MIKCNKAPNIKGKTRGDIYYIMKNGCHICTSHGRNSKRYILTSYKKKTIGLHRLIFFENYGYFPKLVMHKCDNPKCINPNHLIGGTPKENSKDMMKKKRQAFGIKNGGGVKLNDNKAKQIKQLLKRKKMTLQSIADKFKVSKRTVLFIKQNKHWKHV